MPTKLFITGTTGFIGGDILYALTNSSLSKDLEISALIRTQEKASLVQKSYPNIRPVIGSLDDSSVLTSESSRADIVIHTADASDHEGAAKAISKGIVEGHSNSNPGFWLHTGGTGILTYFDTRDNKLGEWEEKQFNDWDGVEELVTLPDEAFHRNVDKIVLETKGEGVYTAIVCPPTIYGKGRGPVSGRSRQAYELASLILKKGYAPVIGKGKARWNGVHVHDLSDLWVSLVQAAVEKKTDEKEMWNEKGYYFAEGGEFVWSELSRLMAKTAAEKGYIKEGWKDQELSYDEAYEVADFQAVSWGLNSRAKAIRAGKLFGWKATRPSIEEEVPNIVEEEKERLDKGS